MLGSTGYRRADHGTRDKTDRRRPAIPVVIIVVVVPGRRWWRIVARRISAASCLLRVLLACCGPRLSGVDILVRRILPLRLIGRAGGLACLLVIGSGLLPSRLVRRTGAAGLPGWLTGLRRNASLALSRCGC